MLGGGGGRGPLGGAGVGGDGGRLSYKDQLPQGIWNELKLRKKNKKMVQLQGFDKTKEFPDEDTFWMFLEKQGLVNLPEMDMDYIDREVMERKYYICMKEEEGAKWLIQYFEKEKPMYNDDNMRDHPITAKQMGDYWKTNS